jgi:hypothetical protein
MVMFGEKSLWKFQGLFFWFLVAFTDFIGIIAKLLFLMRMILLRLYAHIYAATYE